MPSSERPRKHKLSLWFPVPWGAENSWGVSVKCWKGLKFGGLAFGTPGWTQQAWAHFYWRRIHSTSCLAKSSPGGGRLEGGLHLCDWQTQELLVMARVVVFGHVCSLDAHVFSLLRQDGREFCLCRESLQPQSGLSVYLLKSCGTISV